jgi:hypothetical protein
MIHARRLAAVLAIGWLIVVGIGAGINLRPLGIVRTEPDRLAIDGYLQFKGNALTIVACGTAPAVTGTMMAATVVAGSGVVTLCELTFAYTWSNPPVCVASNITGSAVVKPWTTTTTMTLVSQGQDFGGDTVHVLCGGWES